MITGPNDPKLIGLLTRLDRFDKQSQIFNKLDELYLLTQRKGFFNPNANNLEFTSNNNRISDSYSNLQNFNDLNKIVSSHYSNMLMLPSSTTVSASSLASTSPATVLLLPNSFSNNALGFNRNRSVDSYLRMLNNLAKNDVEMKHRIEAVLKAFDNEDDFFFNYVLEFWISGKSFNKMRARKLQDHEGGSGSVPTAAL